ncbi:MAG: type I glyceraldehyde-3-phosphate dehydrogenase [Candidatus Saccharimonas sp.]
MANIRVAINGLGLIGRNALKVALERTDIEVVAVNDVAPLETLAYLIKHDSNYGTYSRTIEVEDDTLIVGEHRIRALSLSDPSRLPWDELDIDVVLECTGQFAEVSRARLHIEAGARKVVVSAPVDTAKSIIMGVNDDELRDGGEIISAASGTTNAIAPVISLIDKNYGVDKIMVTTVHSYLARQVLHDSMAQTLREGRAAAENIVPTEMAASRAIRELMPEVGAHFGGLNVRVPNPVVSLATLVMVLKNETSTIEVNNLIKDSVKQPFYQGVLDASSAELVSSDLKGNSHSAIIDLPLTHVIDGTLLRINVWYDNEWGYANRLVELAADAGRLAHIA